MSPAAAYTGDIQGDVDSAKAALLGASLLRLFPAGFLGLGQEVDLRGDDLASISIDAVLISPFGVVDGPVTIIIAPLATCSATHFPMPLKQVIRCHSVSV